MSGAYRRPVCWSSKYVNVESTDGEYQSVRNAEQVRIAHEWKPAISEAEYEEFLDRAIQRRLATDPAYRNAENAEQQSSREWQIEREEDERLQQKYRVN